MSSVTLEIKNCRRDCPYFSLQPSTHWIGASGYVYTCNKAQKDIMPSEGVSPPPEWCPLRSETSETELQEHVRKLLKAGSFYPSAIESDSETMRDFEGFDEWADKVKELL